MKSVMKEPFVLIAGSAGTAPAPSTNVPRFDPGAPWGIQRETFRREIYGANTICILIRNQDAILVIDHGSGLPYASAFIKEMMEAEKKIVNGVVVHRLQTHYHVDHHCGLPLDPALLDPKYSLCFYSPILPDNNGSMESCLAEYYDGVDWPLKLAFLDQVGAKRLHFRFQPGQKLRLGSLSVETMLLPHPGGCCGYRINIPGTLPVVIATDVELPSADEGIDPNLVKFFDGADTVIIDLQYDDPEYEGIERIGGIKMSRRGWGHSTPKKVFGLLKLCQQLPRKIIAVHHDPQKNDMQLRRFFEKTLNCIESLGLASDFFEFGHDGHMRWPKLQP